MSAPKVASDNEISAMSFEQAMKELENIVQKLESGDVPLAESINIFERGEALRRHCEAQLKEAQLRIEKIRHSNDGTMSIEPMDET